MHISSDQGLSSILREGDYFVVSSGPGGLSVEFSADGPANGPVIGAFASMKGHVLLWKAAEAAEILESRGEDAENFLIREIRRSLGHKQEREKDASEPLHHKLARLLQAYAQEYGNLGHSETFVGWLKEFHEQIIMAIHPQPLNAAMKRAILKLPELLPGIQITQEGRGPGWSRIRADWSMVAGEP